MKNDKKCMHFLLQRTLTLWARSTSQIQIENSLLPFNRTMDLLVVNIIVAQLVFTYRVGQKIQKESSNEIYRCHKCIFSTNILAMAAWHHCLLCFAPLG